MLISAPVKPNFSCNSTLGAYYVISGSGKAIIDNEEVNLVTGDWVRISPVAERQFFANKNKSRNIY